MNSKTTLLIVFLFTSVLVRATECATAYQDVTYGLQHVTTAMETNNMTQLKQYAERSKIALEKVRASTELCGCTDANYASYDALENLNKALEKDKYDQVRLFVGRAKKFAKSVMISLDICKQNEPSIAIEEAAVSLAEKEAALKEQQRELEAQQRKLAKQIEEQKELQASIKAQKEEMLVAQKALQVKAESSLEQMEQMILGFTEDLGCGIKTPLTASTFKRTNNELEAESLQATKIFYANKASEMANYLFNTLQDCEWKKN